ncbi:MAG TPA: lipid-binding SYLF domain-containing protein [Bacteroidota bacterium]|jgi:lipid-binding SYLF domain-containing protein
MKRSICFLAVSIICFLALNGCSTAPTSAEGRSAIQDESAAVLATAQTNDPTFTKVLNDAYGYAVFPSIGKGAIGVGGAYGKGVLYGKGTARGYCAMTQASIGLSLGGQKYAEIIAFTTKEAFDNFKTGNFAFDAQVTVVALKSGASANAKYTNGVAVFTLDEAGLMYEASVGGQKFSYQAMSPR